MKNKIIIGWLYPQLMNTYGDRGNIICLQKRCEWRGIDCEILELNVGFSKDNLNQCDLLFMGGAQDRQQKIVTEDIKGEKTKIIKELIEKGIPGLYICGAYQFLGKYYKEADGTVIEGLKILDLYTQNPGLTEKRLIGNIATQAVLNGKKYTLVGFENHGGRTFIQDNKAFGRVIYGSGNNAEDKTEGIIYKNSFGTYLHGPILPKNPVFADFLIETSLKIKYKKEIPLQKVDNNLEEKARAAIANKINVEL